MYDEKQFLQNIERIKQRQRRGMNAIKRESARWRLFACPLFALVFAGMAYLHWSDGRPMMAMIYAAGALAFLLMLLLGAILDRPSYD